MATGGLGACTHESGPSALAVGELLACTEGNARLQQAILAADTDGDGTLSVKEVFKIFTSEAQARSDRRRALRLAAVLGGLLLLVLAANAGLTFAVVALSADTSTSQDGVMRVKGADTVVRTAEYRRVGSDWQALLWVAPHNASSLRALVLPGAGGTLDFFQVAGGTVERGRRTVLHSPWGATLTVTPEGMRLQDAPPGGCAAAGTAAPAGSRRLHFNGPILNPDEILLSMGCQSGDSC